MKNIQPTNTKFQIKNLKFSIPLELISWQKCRDVLVSFNIFLRYYSTRIEPCFVIIYKKIHVIYRLNYTNNTERGQKFHERTRHRDNLLKSYLIRYLIALPDNPGQPRRRARARSLSRDRFNVCKLPWREILLGLDQRNADYDNTVEACKSISWNLRYFLRFLTFRRGCPKIDGGEFLPSRNSLIHVWLQ